MVAVLYPQIVWAGPIESDIWGRIWNQGLLSPTLAKQRLLEESRNYFQNTSTSNFKGPVLGFVTPWNGAGYDMARLFRHKFTYVTPCWYQLRRSRPDRRFVLAGQHDVDQSWMQDLRVPMHQGAVVPKIVPRVVFELGPQDTMDMLKSASRIALKIVRECSQQGFDGVVVEAWAGWQASGLLTGPHHDQALAFMLGLSDALHEAGLLLLMAVQPATSVKGAGHKPTLRATDWDALKSRVDAVTIMTYDAPSWGPTEFNAPLDWFQSNIEALAPKTELAGCNAFAHKALLGLNFYGWDYSAGQPPEAILGSRFREFLQLDTADLRWDAAVAEHVLTYPHKGEMHRTFYPSLKSMHERLQTAATSETGISIWELGQGLEYFFDLL
ncbi:hypothetical protein WJX74_002741 [Apatococcus lobatus]|uniref:Chitinase domain-containing protein 1 n=2 Tax=Apatococcus TaxID=904362 RepID=A0AAW1TCE3_9CHLO